MILPLHFCGVWVEVVNVFDILYSIILLEGYNNCFFKYLSIYFIYTSLTLNAYHKAKAQIGQPQKWMISNHRIKWMDSLSGKVVHIMT